MTTPDRIWANSGSKTFVPATDEFKKYATEFANEYTRTDNRIEDVDTKLPLVGNGPLPDQERGLYEKYTVFRNDGSLKHKNCEYFVLDLTHDKHAKVAILSYAESCETEYPQLAQDLRNIT